MTFEELGLLLQEERKKNGFSIEEVADKLKISINVLHAVEEGNTSNLPQVVYVRSFISSYARMLGLDAQEILESVDFFNTNSVYNTPVYSNNTESKSSLKVFYYAILILIVAGMAFGLWTYRDADLFSDLQKAHISDVGSSSPNTISSNSLINTNAELEQEDLRQVDTNSNVVEETNTNELSQEEFENSVAENTINNTDEHQNSIESTLVNVEQKENNIQDTKQEVQDEIQEVKKEDKQEIKKEIKEEVKEDKQEVKKEINEQKTSNSPYMIILTAVEECWIQSVADGKNTRSFSLHKGDNFTLAFDKSLKLRLGNAGGVRVRYNGKDLPPLGKSGQVLTVTYPPK